MGGKVGGAGGAVLGPAPGDPGFALLALVEAAAVIKPRAMGASASSRLERAAER